MEFYKQILPVTIDRKERKNIIKSLSKEYSAILEGADDVIKDKLNIVCLNYAANAWELFKDNVSGCILYIFIPQHHKHIEVGCFANDVKEKKIFENFKSSVKKTIIAHGYDAENLRWRQFLFPNERFNVIDSDSSEKSFGGTSDSTTIEALKDKQIRSILRLIGSGEKLMDHIAENFPQTDIFSTIDKFINLNLVSKNFYVYCRKTGHQISRVKDIESIQDASSRGMQCPFCGKIFMEERIEQILSITAEGEKFVKKNYWLSLYVGYTLLNLGIAQGNISIRQENDLSNSDIFVSHFGKLIYIAIKESPLAYEDIYLFAKRAKFYEADKTILITDSKTDVNLNLFLANIAEDISIIDSVEQTSDVLIDILEKIKIKSALDAIEQFGPMTNINLKTTISDYFFKNKREELISKLEGTNVYAHTSLINEEEKDMLYIEDEEALIEEVISEAIFSAEIEDEPIDMQDGGETNQEEIKQSDGEQAEEDEKSDVSDELLNVEEDIEEEEEEEDFLIPETIKAGFQYGNEIEIPELSAKEKHLDEIQNKIAEEIIKTADSEGVDASYMTMEETIAEMAKDEIQTIISDESGFAIISTNTDSESSDSISAYGTELLYNLKSDMKELLNKEIVSVFADTADFAISLYPLNGGIISFKRIKENENIQEFPASSSVEIRNSIADKIFDKLKSIEAINELILFDENGDVAQKRTEDLKTVEAIQAFIKEFSLQNLDLAQSMTGGKTIQQFCISTEDIIYSFVFFSDGSVFVALVDASAGREIWNLKIIESAKLLA